MERWAAPIARLADELIDALVPLGSGDFHALFAMPLPMKAMALAIGISQDRHEDYKRWSNAFMRASFNAPEESARAMEPLYAFFAEQFETRRQALRAAGVTEPGPEHVGPVLSDDLISVLMTAKFQGRYLSEDELKRTVRGFFIGGNETTTSLLLNILVRLFEDRTRWEAVSADPSLIEGLIEESLRCDPPTIGMVRSSRCPVNVAGTEIEADARVLYSIPSANRDPAMFSEPDRFIIDRPRRERARHVAFSYGSHFCPGAWLSRMEARIALEIIVRRLPKLRLTGAGERIEPFNFWGLKNLPAAWD